MLIVVVAGLPGSGKTHWIREQLTQAQSPIRYFNPGTSSVDIDGIALATAFPQLQVLTEGQESELFATGTDTTTYIELPWHLQLSTLEPLLQSLNCQRVAMMPLTEETKNWADETVLGNQVAQDYLSQVESRTSQLQIHRGLLTGEIIDWASLTTLWFELIHGAYGKVIRAKGIFDIVSGESIYGDFVAGTVNQEFVALDLPQWLEGRPQRFSGFEIVGQDLNQAAITQTIKDCCLPESQIEAYQQQVKQSLELEEEIAP
jgi:G3E family GTPase